MPLGLEQALKAPWRLDPVLSIPLKVQMFFCLAGLLLSLYGSVAQPVLPSLGPQEKEALKYLAHACCCGSAFKSASIFLKFCALWGLVYSATAVQLFRASYQTQKRASYSSTMVLASAGFSFAGALICVGAPVYTICIKARERRRNKRTRKRQ